MRVNENIVRFAIKHLHILREVVKECYGKGFKEMLQYIIDNWKDVNVTVTKSIVKLIKMKLLLYSIPKDSYIKVVMDKGEQVGKIKLIGENFIILDNNDNMIYVDLIAVKDIVEL